MRGSKDLDPGLHKPVRSSLFCGGAIHIFSQRTGEWRRLRSWKAVLINKESLAPKDTAQWNLSFGFSSVNIKLYKSDSNDRANPDATQEELVLDTEASDTEDCYSTDASLLGTMAASRVIEEDICDGEVTEITMVDGILSDIITDPADKLSPL